MDAEGAHENADEDFWQFQVLADDVVDRGRPALLADDHRLARRGALDIDHGAVGRAEEMLAERDRPRRIRQNQ